MPRGDKRKARAFAKKLMRQLNPNRVYNTGDKATNNDKTKTKQGSSKTTTTNTSQKPPRKKQKKSEKKTRDLRDKIEGIPSLLEILPYISDETKAIEFLHHKGLIDMPPQCMRCHQTAQVDWVRKQFRCRKVNCLYKQPTCCESCPNQQLDPFQTPLGDTGVTCPECKWQWKPGQEHASSFFKGTFLAGCTRTPITEVVLLLYLWCTNATLLQVCQQTGWGHKTASTWMHTIRQLVQEMVVHQPHDNNNNNRIGGHGKVVEMAERTFDKRNDTTNKWVLGMVERTPERKMVLLVMDRTRQSLENAIREYVHPGCTIHTNIWKGHIRLERLGYDTKVLRQKYKFVGDDVGQRAIPVHPVGGTDLQEYLFVFMWKRKNAGRIWEALLEGLATIRLTKKELERLLAVKEQPQRNNNKDDNDSVNFDDELVYDALQDNGNGDEFITFGDHQYTPQEESSEGEESDDEERTGMMEAVASEVFGEILATGAIDRPILFDGGRR